MKRAPLYEQLKLYVRQLIADNAGKKDFLLPSEASLSQTFSVSRITAKRTLNDLEEAGLVVRKKGKGTYISPDVTRERAESLLGKSQPPKIYSTNSNTLSVIVPDITSRYYINILNGILHYTEQNNWLVQIANTNVSQEKEIEFIKNMRFYSNGMIIFPVNYNTYAKEVIRLSFKNYPFVFIDNYLYNTNIPCIVSDNFDALYKATQYLIGKGKRNIAYITFPEKNDLSLEERYLGYEAALKDNGLPVRKELIFNSYSHTQVMVDNKIREFLKNGKEIDGVLTSICGLGIIAAREMLNMGLTELLDNLIIFDDEFDRLTDLLKFRPKFIRQDAYRIGYTAAEILINQFSNPEPAISQTIIRIPTELHL